MSYQKSSVVVYDADSLYKHSKKEIKVGDVLEQLIDSLASLAEISEFAPSMPEIVVTVSAQVWKQIEESQAYGFLQATAEGDIPGTDFKYLEFKLAKSKSRLIIQEGPSTSVLEIVS